MRRGSDPRRCGLPGRAGSREAFGQSHGRGARAHLRRLPRDVRELKGEHFVPLAGMDEGEFITSMKEFRSHKRPSSIMSHIAEGYSDEEFERMARYFNGIRIKGDVK